MEIADLALNLFLHGFAVLEREAEVLLRLRELLGPFLGSGLQVDAEGSGFLGRGFGELDGFGVARAASYRAGIMSAEMADEAFVLGRLAALYRVCQFQSPLEEIGIEAQDSRMLHEDVRAKTAGC